LGFFGFLGEVSVGWAGFVVFKDGWCAVCGAPFKNPSARAFSKLTGIFNLHSARISYPYLDFFGFLGEVSVGWAGFVVFKDGWCAVYGGRSV
jgi:hypothetical protein